MDDIATKFFEKSEKCPEEIINCEDIRKDYFQSLDEFMSKHGCGPCAQRHIRNKFLEKIKQNFKK